MANDDLSALRAQARNRHTAVTKKISRLRRVNDVELSHTQYDPRRDLAKLKRYTAPQLRAYIAKLDTFQGRSQQYLRGAYGSVITAESWRTFQSAQRAVSKRNKVEFEKISKIFMPIFNQTIGERIAMLAKPSRMGNNLAANRPFDEVAKSARGLMGNKGAKIQAEQMLKRLTPEWIPNRISADRENMHKMAAVIGESNVSRLTDSLTDAQFNVLWNYTGFATNYSMNYDNMKTMLTGFDEAWHMSTASDALEESRALIEWIKTLNLGG